jgi:hypothetical protein
LFRDLLVVLFGVVEAGLTEEGHRTVAVVMAAHLQEVLPRR